MLVNTVDLYHLTQKSFEELLNISDIDQLQGKKNWI